MSKFDEFYKKVTELHKKTEDLAKKIKNNEIKRDNAKEGISLVDFDHVSYKEIEELVKNKKILHGANSIRQYSAEKMLSQVVDLNKYLDFMKKKEIFDSEDSLNNSIDGMYLYLFEKFSNYVAKPGNGPLSNLFEQSSLKYLDEVETNPTNARIKIIKDFFDSLKDSPLREKAFIDNTSEIFTNLKIYYFDKLENINHFYEYNKEYGNDLEVLNFEESYEDYDYRVNVDLYPYNDKIQELKDNNKNDIEYISILDSANENIRLGDKESRSLSSNIAETHGCEVDRRVYEGVEKLLLTSKPDLKDYLKYESTSLVLTEDTEENYEYVKNETKSFFNNKLPNEFKNNVKAIYQKMVKYNIFRKETYQTEASEKIYSFNKLVTKKQELMNAVDSKNKEEITKKLNEYKETEKQYDELLNDIRKAFPTDDISGNISSAREEKIPAKYRNDHVGASRLTGLWQMMGFLSVYNIDIDDFLQDPFGTIEAYLEDYSKVMPHNELLKGNDVASIWKKTDDAFSTVPQSDSSNLVIRLGRVIDPLVRLIPDDKLRAKFQTEYFLSNALTYSIALQNNSKVTGYTFENKENGMMNILLTEEEDRDFRKFVPNYIDITTGKKPHFDCVKYMDEHRNYESILLRVYETRKSILDNYNNAEWAQSLLNKTQEAFTLVNTHCRNKTDLITNCIRRMANGEPLKNTMIENLKSVSEFKRIAYKGVDDNTITDLAHVYRDLKAKYDSRSIFAQIFYSNVREQKLLLDAYLISLKKNGYSKETINDINSGKITIEKEIVGKTDKHLFNIDKDVTNDNLENEPIEEFEANPDLNKSFIEREIE